MRADRTKGTIDKNQEYGIFTSNPKINLRSGLVYQLQPYNYTDSNTITSNSYLNTFNRSNFSKNKKPMGRGQNPHAVNLWEFFNKNAIVRAYPNVSERTLGGSLTLSEAEASGKFSDAGISALNLNWSALDLAYFNVSKKSSLFTSEGSVLNYPGLANQGEDFIFKNSDHSNLNR